MRKSVTITIDAEIWEWLKENYINKSALIETLIRKHYNGELKQKA